MGYHVVRGDEHDYEERPYVEGEEARLAADVTAPAQLAQSRARIWRYPPHTRGRRHADHAQEEVFVVLAGTLTMLLAERRRRSRRELAPRRGSTCAAGLRSGTRRASGRLRPR